MGKSRKIILRAPVDGTVIPLKEVPDPVFAEATMGDGVGFRPKSGDILSPADGTIVTVAETKHAYAIETPEGVSILVHFGLETVGLKGEGFAPKVEAGSKVKAGDLLCKADLKLIQGKNWKQSRRWSSPTCRTGRRCRSITGR